MTLLKSVVGREWPKKFLHVRPGDQSPQMNVAGPDRNRDLLNTSRTRTRLGYRARLKL